MVRGVFLCVATGAVWTAIAVLYRSVAGDHKTIVGFHLVAKVLGFCVSWSLFVRWNAIDTGYWREQAPMLGIIYIGASIGAIYPFFMSRAMRLGGSGISWAVGQAAMVVPLLVAIIVWGEAVTPARTVGFFAILAMVTALGAGDSTGRREGTWYSMMALTFLLIGTSQALVSIPSHTEAWIDGANIRVATVSTAALAVYIVLGVAVGPHFSPRTVVLGGVHALLAPLSHQLSFSAMDVLGTFGMVGFFFPIAIGVSMVGVAAFGIVSGDERATPRAIVGLAVGILGIFLVSVG